MANAHAGQFDFKALEFLWKGIDLVKSSRGCGSSVGKGSWIKVPLKRCNWTVVSSIPGRGIGIRKNPSRAFYEASIEVSFWEVDEEKNKKFLLRLFQTKNDDGKSIRALSAACLLSLAVAYGDTGKLLTAASSMLMAQRGFELITMPSILTALQRSVISIMLGQTDHPGKSWQNTSDCNWGLWVCDKIF